ncbi:hypothetical protein SAXI111661_05275 [Saccharomonospora xinjiangensis]|uniref:hypothetical protein n=1 Tax=Saccharomonospora xinjiangensis TaxID=75294 RepID=UPI00106FC877|nr:hypothetical protein [Saccharomonospora xinjiangensis]QBQ58886.1 hypothetical protein EYD13_02515 [Saccharomonospora xinjiangensis]
MTSKADPTFIERLRAIQSATRARSEAIAEHTRRTSEKLAERSQQHLQAMRTHIAEADKRRAEYLQQQAQDDAAAKNQWLKRREVSEATYDFGASEGIEEDTAPQRPVPPAPVAPPTPTAMEFPRAQPQPNSVSPRRENRQPNHFDDDDFSNNSWME